MAHKTRECAALILAVWTVSAAACHDESSADGSSEKVLRRHGLEGLFHLAGERGDLNPTNLRLEPDGTFAWGVSGCDYFGGDIGTWTVEGDEIVLHPSKGAERFLWSGRVTEPVEHVVITPNELGFHASSPAQSWNDQEWVPGGVCPDCASQGPSSACDDPYLADEASL